jgi:exonuclease SbcD
MDDYQQAITREIYEVFDLAREHRANGIIVPGDLFDSPGAALGTIADLAIILQAAPCVVLAIHGNHDIWGGNPGSKYRTPFWLLARLGLIKDLEKEPAFYGANLGATVTGYGFNTETDTEAGMIQFGPPMYSEPIYANFASLFEVRVVHSMLLLRPPGFEMRHTLIGDVKTTARVIISGHDHIGFGIRRREDGVLFINPGALCRLSAHPAEMERQVQAALLTIENGKASAELIPLKSARPGHEILSREHLEIEAEREERISRFLGLLAAGGEMKFLEVREIVEQIARQESLPQAVIRDALARIGRAREELGVA